MQKNKILKLGIYIISGLLVATGGTYSAPHPQYNNIHIEENHS